MFMKSFICDSALIRYKRRNFGCSCSTVKSTVFEEQGTISAVSRIPLEGFY